jgi:hypothetical protein
MVQGSLRGLRRGNYSNDRNCSPNLGFNLHMRFVRLDIQTGVHCEAECTLLLIALDLGFDP